MRRIVSRKERRQEDERLQRVREIAEKGCDVKEKQERRQGNKTADG